MSTRDERVTALRAGVEYLASPELEGRAPGTAGGVLARQFVENAFESIGLGPAGEDRYTQAIPAIDGANLLGIIPGKGPTADRFIVVAAHYDHLGIWFDNVHPGANDNASGVAVLLDVAERLAASDELNRSILVCSFDAEEPPHFLTENMGSIHFVANPTVPLNQIDLMICLDSVGTALGSATMPPEVRESIFVLGAELATGVGDLVDRLGADVDGIRPRRLDGDVIPLFSDHFAFQQAGIPFLFISVRRNRHYHTPEDTAEKLDYDKMLALADYVTALTTELSGFPVSYAPHGHDDAATLTTLTELGTLVGPHTSRPHRVMALVGKLEEHLASGETLQQDDRGALSMLLTKLEEALE